MEERGAKLRLTISTVRLRDALRHLDAMHDVMPDVEAMSNELGPAYEAILDVIKTLRDLERRL